MKLNYKYQIVLLNNCRKERFRMGLKCLRCLDTFSPFVKFIFCTKKKYNNICLQLTFVSLSTTNLTCTWQYIYCTKLYFCLESICSFYFVCQLSMSNLVCQIRWNEYKNCYLSSFIFITGARSEEATTHKYLIKVNSSSDCLPASLEAKTRAKREILALYCIHYTSSNIVSYVTIISST